MTGRPRPDPLHKGTLTFRQHGVGVELEVLEGVFAGAGVDAGTKQLLRRLADDRFGPARRVLDLGCGYGPLGLWLAAAEPTREVLLVDRDARAVAAGGLGAAKNGLSQVDSVGSLGYDGAGADPFDLVVSNIPAKIGSAALQHLLLDAHHHLSADGLVAVVVIDRLVAEVAEVLDDLAAELVVSHPSKTYTVFVYRFRGAPEASSAGPGFERGVYRRGGGAYGAGGLTWEARQVVHSIPEFDSLGHGTLAAVPLLPATAGTVTIHGVGQGHVPLALRAKGNDAELRLVDRDLLALRTTAANLDDGSDLRHHPRLLADDVAGADLVVVALPEKEPVARTATLLGEALAGYDRRVLLHGRTADVQRVRELLRRHGCRLVEERSERAHGHAALLAHPR